MKLQQFIGRATLTFVLDKLTEKTAFHIVLCLRSLTLQLGNSCSLPKRNQIVEPCLLGPSGTPQTHGNMSLEQQ